MGPLRHGGDLRTRCVRASEDTDSYRHFGLYLESLPEGANPSEEYDPRIGRHFSA